MSERRAPQESYRRLFARASWAHARARVADLLDEELSADETAVAELLRGVVVLDKPAAVDGDELARRFVLTLARWHAAS